MDLLREALPGDHIWWRVADPAWSDPLDASSAGRSGGRWNPPDSFPVLYLNEDRMTARLNLRAFIEDWPYEPEDLRDDTAPALVGCVLPGRQIVCEAHSSAGLRAAGLPATYPLDEAGGVVPHARCQPIGVQARAASLRGVHARSARSRDGSGRELAWFPAVIRSRARPVTTLALSEWFWSSADPPGTGTRDAAEADIEAARRLLRRGGGEPPAPEDRIPQEGAVAVRVGTTGIRISCRGAGRNFDPCRPRKGTEHSRYTVRLSVGSEMLETGCCLIVP